ncbi:hypothetical protein [Actinomycetospora aeridis]|uniref:Uncharacterized protein n=1 Tax=Actinomycetospora aeridis TaxID=3129231 RepID=A0ABU8N600_9PSEU
MFRRSTRPTPLFPADAATEGTAEGAAGSAGSAAQDAGPRHTRRARQRKADDAAALRARLERVERRLAEVGSVQVTAHGSAIDNAVARRDPLTRPFAAPLPRPVGELPGARRSVTAPLRRPA